MILLKTGSDMVFMVCSEWTNVHRIYLGCGAHKTANLCRKSYQIIQDI